MTGYAESDLTLDAFLGGKVQLLQLKKGYRAGVDPVLLAATVPAFPGQTVLDLGCGAGAAILCLAARVPHLILTGVEREGAYAALARRNGAGALEVVETDIAAMPLHLRDRQFDHVLANPPYFDRRASRASTDPTREAAHGAETPLEDWVRIAGKRLKPKGIVHFIHRAERLPDLLAAVPRDLGSIEVLPITGRAGRRAERVIVRARKNGRADFRLHPPCILHAEMAHMSDADKDYTPAIRAVLAEGAALEF